jgi:hypothetical protein
VDYRKTCLDSTRKYKITDVHDIGHATAALPYCDIFLTEHSLRHLLTRQDLGLDRQFKCIVISDTKVAIDRLKIVTG